VNALSIIAYTMMYSSKTCHTQQNVWRDRLCRMIRWVVREVAERAGIRNARELAARTGLPPTSVYRIWADKATRTDLTTIDKLCTALEVKPGQLFEHEAEPDRLLKSELKRSHRRPPTKHKANG
jgi:DNA-binding Xre family transcriptional regulator